MKKEKRWKEITSEGRLIEPANLGPYYEEDNLNDNAPFENENDAIAEFERLKKKHEFIYSQRPINRRDDAPRR